MCEFRGGNKNLFKSNIFRGVRSNAVLKRWESGQVCVTEIWFCFIGFFTTFGLFNRWSFDSDKENCKLFRLCRERLGFTDRL